MDKTYKLKIWLFEGEKPGSSYDERSLSQVLKSALRRDGIWKPVSLHWLRHSYAIHLSESGIDLDYNQKLLGCNSSRTTEIHTHVSARGIQRSALPLMIFEKIIVLNKVHQTWIRPAGCCELEHIFAGISKLGAIFIRT